MNDRKHVALDSAQIGNWCRDRASSASEVRTAVLEFEDAFLSGGCTLVLTLHHIVELLRSSPEVALQRLQFLSSLPHVAWLRSRRKGGGIGSVIDIMAAEVLAALTLSDPTEVRNKVRQEIFETGSGWDALGPKPSEWLKLRPLAFNQAESDRRNVAITRSQTIKAPKLTIAQLKAASFRSREDAMKIFPTLAKALAIDVRDRGDKRLQNPTLVAATFFLEVVDHAAGLEGKFEEAMRKDLAKMDVDLDELGEKAYLDDLLELVVFRQKMRVISREIPHLGWEEIKSKATFEKLPSAMIERGLRLYGQDQKERKGSEINDRYLATLACYADVTYVDKRTLSDIQDVKRRFPVLKEIMQQTHKISNWRTATGQLNH